MHNDCSKDHLISLPLDRERSKTIFKALIFLLGMKIADIFSACCFISFMKGALWPANNWMPKANRWDTAGMREAHRK